MAGIYALFAILSLSAAAIGLVVGLLLITASYFGPWVATLIVVLVFGLAAWILALRARKTARALNFDESDD
jgi:F0F1-type ATP synthase assembly protein I